jgi:hypothetical protein
VAEGKDHWGTHSILFQIAFAQHDEARIKSEGGWGLNHQSANESLDDLAFASASSGKLREAMDEFSRSRDAALRGGDVDYADSVLVDEGIAQVGLGDIAGAAASLKQLKGDAGDPGQVALLKAELGDLAPAQRYVAAVAADTEKQDTVVLYCEVPLLRAFLALKAHKPADAVQALEPARPYQMRNFAVPSLRAQSETEAGMLDAAAADYRLILDNQGVDPIAPDYTLSHLRLARVLALQKKNADARKEYQAFFDAWKDADADLSLLKDAKREFARLP